MTNCVSVPDQYHWNLLHPNQIAFSRLMTDRALTEWFERVEEYMPKVEDYEVPDQITLGEPFAISGAGYHEGDTVELTVKFSDESVMPLGELPLDHSSGPHHQDSGEAKIRESTAGVSRKPSSDGKARGCSSKHLCGLTAWNT